MTPTLDKNIAFLDKLTRCRPRLQVPVGDGPHRRQDRNQRGAGRGVAAEHGVLGSRAPCSSRGSTRATRSVPAGLVSRHTTSGRQGRHSGASSTTTTRPAAVIPPTRRGLTDVWNKGSPAVQAVRQRSVPDPPARMRGRRTAGRRHPTGPVVEGGAVQVTDQFLLTRLAAMWESKLNWPFDVVDEGFRERTSDIAARSSTPRARPRCSPWRPPRSSRLARANRSARPDTLRVATARS